MSEKTQILFTIRELLLKTLNSYSPYRYNKTYSDEQLIQMIFIEKLVSNINDMVEEEYSKEE